jgi:hypothetical protein
VAASKGPQFERLWLELRRSGELVYFEPHPTRGAPGRSEQASVPAKSSGTATHPPHIRLENLPRWGHERVDFEQLARRTSRLPAPTLGPEIPAAPPRLPDVRVRLRHSARRASGWTLRGKTHRSVAAILLGVWTALVSVIAWFAQQQTS